MGDNREDPTIFDPNQSRRDGKTYVITRQYRMRNEDPNDDRMENEVISLDLDATEIDLNHSRVATIANFNVLTKTEFLGLRNNMIDKIEGISQLTSLRELELYDNQITKIESLDALVNLE